MGLVYVCPLRHKEFEIPTLSSKIFQDIEVSVFVRSCAQVILRKFSGLLSKLNILKKSY